ncbi:MAG TPA: FKBP-type peptidyl-prolyl cis-trans isomerase [Longimicrobiaceae bacterium]|nr:FKBP-type peptidyl-prolyl cis-trans isomerase [Longimicrobiaceae bacterium]
MMKHLVWLGLLASLLVTTACNDSTAVTGPPQVTGDTITLPSGLKYIEVRTGAGAVANVGDSVSVHYTGWLEDGTRFDTSRQGGRGPFAFRVGTGNVIQGWHQGLPGLRVGGMRRLIIPPGLAYGAQGRPPAIPPDATLIFDIELMRIFTP